MSHELNTHFLFESPVIVIIWALYFCAISSDPVLAICLGPLGPSFVIAIIELEEGPRITSQVVDCEPEIVKPGMKVKSVFRKLGEDSESGILHYGTKFIPDEVLQTENDEGDDIADVELWLDTYISVDCPST